MLSDDEAQTLNEQLAVKLGWISDTCAGRGWQYTQWRRAGEPPMQTLPDFCRDNHAAGYLLDYIEANSLYCSNGISRQRKYHVTIAENFSAGGYCAWGHTLGEAIVRAILTAKEEGQK